MAKFATYKLFLNFVNQNKFLFVSKFFVLLNLTFPQEDEAFSNIALVKRI
jgi:hypothetical protein